MTKVFKNITLFLVAGLLFVGCEAINNSNKTQRGAVIGAASGAILGAILGNNDSRTEGYLGEGQE